MQNRSIRLSIFQANAKEAFLFLAKAKRLGNLMEQIPKGRRSFHRLTEVPEEGKHLAMSL
jgi:hypothetical protein